MQGSPQRELDAKDAVRHNFGRANEISVKTIAFNFETVINFIVNWVNINNVLARTYFRQPRRSNHDHRINYPIDVSNCAYDNKCCRAFEV